MLILFAQYCCAEQLLDLNVKRINPYDKRESWFKGLCRTLLDVFLPKPRSLRDSNPRPHNFGRHMFETRRGGGGGLFRICTKLRAYSSLFYHYQRTLNRRTYLQNLCGKWDESNKTNAHSNQTLHRSCSPALKFISPVETIQERH